MDASELAKILEQHALWANNEGGERADLRVAYLQGADLQGAYLQRAYLEGAILVGADLQGAYLQGADLQGADLQGADLQGADLRGADLRAADLEGAILVGADLRVAYLQRAYLQRADLQGADLDYSCWPLWCGSKAVKVDARIAAQLAAHFCALDCDDPAYQAARAAVLEFAKTSHRAEDLGLFEQEA